MKKIDIKTLFATSSIFLLIALLTIYYYGALPDTMVTHFGVKGESNSSMAKYMMILTTLLFFCVHLFISVLYDVKGIGKTPVIRVVKWIFPLLALIIQVALLQFNLGGELDYRRLVIGLLAIGYMVIGNYLPKEELGSKTNEIERKGRKQAGRLSLHYWWIIDAS